MFINFTKIKLTLKNRIFNVLILSIFLTSQIQADWVTVNNGLNVLSVNTISSFTNNGTNYIFIGLIWTLQGGISMSTNDGSTWNNILLTNYPVWTVTNNFKGTFNSVYFGTSANIFHSTNIGLNWSELYFTNGNHWITDIKANENYLFAGCKWNINDNGGIYVSSNSGTNWVQTYTNVQINSLAVDSNNIYAAAGGIENLFSGVLKSSDYGKTWHELSLPNTKVLCISVNDNYVIAGTYSSGIYLSTNYGLNWIQTSTDNYTRTVLFHNNMVYAGGGSTKFQVSTNYGLTWQTRNEGGINSVTSLCISNNFIFAGTGGGGVYRRPLLEILNISQNSEEIPTGYKLYQNYPNPFNPETKIKYQVINNRTNVKLEIFNITGKLVSTLVDGEQSTGTYEINFKPKDLTSGIYFYQMLADNIIVDSKKLIFLK